MIIKLSLKNSEEGKAMITVKFFNLLRSIHGISELQLKPGALQDVMNQILIEIPKMTKKELEDAIVFVNQAKITHLNRFSYLVNDGDIVMFTNFVGGG